MEEEIKEPSEINTDALEAVFEVDAIEEDGESILLFQADQTELDADVLDLPFNSNDEGYW